MFNPKELGIAGGTGLLLGIGLVSWTNPATSAGAGLLLIVTMVTTCLISEIGLAIVRNLSSATGKPPRKRANAKK